MKQKIKLRNKIMMICIGVLFLFAFSIVLRFFTRQVVILKLGIENAFTSLIFWDNDALASAEDNTEIEYGVTDDYSINWAIEYPFKDKNKSIEKEKDIDNFIEKYSSKIIAIEKRVERYTQDDLAGYTAITEFGRSYEEFIGWNFVSYNEYNGTYQLSDGHWTSLKEKNDVSEHISSTMQLATFCEAQGTNFMYIQAPYKVSKYTDTDVSGVVDFSNQNADEMLAGLSSGGVFALDLRENIWKKELPQHELFYRTDHHWKAETGLWGAGEIVEELNQKYNFNIDVSLFDMKNFDSVIYPEWFLGSYGKKVTLSQAKPDDIALLYPKYDTNLHFVVPSIGIDKVGDFSIIYNMEEIENCDYYNLDPYATYIYGDRAIIHFENLNNYDKKKILVIHDSFADTVVPFLALGVEYVDSIDLRYFNGSLETFIKESQPDLVIVMYNAGDLADDVEYISHTSTYDFR